MKFFILIWKVEFSNCSFCLTTSTGWGNELEDPLNSSALTLIGWNLSLFFSLFLHWTRIGSGIDFIVTMTHCVPSSFSSNLAKITSGISIKQKILLFVSRKVFCDFIICVWYVLRERYYLIICLSGKLLL